MALVLAIHRCERGSGLGRLRKVVALLIYTQHGFKEFFDSAYFVQGFDFCTRVAPAVHSIQAGIAAPCEIVPA